MSNFLISFLVALGGSVWIYTIFSRRTGGNAQAAAITAGIIGIFIFAILMFVTGLLPD